MKPLARRAGLAAAIGCVLLGANASGARAFDREHAAWDRTLRSFTQDGRVDYKALKAAPGGLDEYLRAVGSLSDSEYAALSRADKLAFWINAYNALTVKAVLDHYPIQPSFPASLRYPKNSIRQIPGVWDELKFLVMGRGMTLDDIEHKTLRRQFREPRAHMALVCASVGCPPLRGEAYTASKLEAQLDDQARRFLAALSTLRIDRGASRVYLSPIFKWFGEDFIAAYAPDKGFEGRPPAERAVLGFVGRYIGDRDARFLREEKYAVKYLDYDWSLNEKASP